MSNRFKKIISISLCILLLSSVLPMSVFAGTRTKVNTFIATSDISDILKYANDFKTVTYNEDPQSPAYILDDTPYSFEFKTSTDDWIDYYADTFIEGTYRINTQVRIDGD